MNIRGINKFTLVDYPGKIACIVFVGECNFACPFCHNACLTLDPESQPLVTEADFFSFLEKRRGRLDAVVVSGGEPTLGKNLVSFSQKIKGMGFLVKVDTNGSKPGMIKQLHSSSAIDYIGIDYKYPRKRYSELSKTLADLSEKVQGTISYAITTKIPYDIRTTVHKELLSFEDLSTMREELNELGVKEWALQQFNSADILDDRLLKYPTYSDLELTNIAKILQNTKIRGTKIK